MYKIALRRLPDPRAILQAEEFISRVLDEEPDKAQLHYCLGLLNLLFKGDKTRALEELRRFTEVAPIPEFAREIEAAKSYVQQIAAELDEASSP